MKNKLYLVETISMFRHRYVVEAKNAEHAEEEVMCNVGHAYQEDFEEFSQKHIEEIITSSREISELQYLQLFDKDNDYLKNWSRKQKYRFINVVDYGDNDGDSEETVKEENDY